MISKDMCNMQESFTTNLKIIINEYYKAWIYKSISHWFKLTNL